MAVADAKAGGLTCRLRTGGGRFRFSPTASTPAGTCARRDPGACGSREALYHLSEQVRPPGTPGLCARLLFPGLKAPSASLGTGSDFCRPAFGLAQARVCFAGVFVRGCGCCVCRCDLSQSSPMRACLGHPPAVGYRRSFDCGWRFAPTFAQEGSYLFFMDWWGDGRKAGALALARHYPFEIFSRRCRVSG